MSSTGDSPIKTGGGSAMSSNNDATTTNASASASPEDYYCLDDGTGRNVYYIHKVSGAKSRNKPEGFTDEYFENGERRYYFRGSCLRCKKKQPNFCPTVLSMNGSSKLFSLNICEECTISTTPAITNGRVRGNGDLVWAQHKDTCKIMYIELEKRVLNPKRDAEMQEKAKVALFWLLTYQKRRRDLSRMNRCKNLARVYGVEEGDIIYLSLNPTHKMKYMSFGFGDVFDEYYGMYNDAGQPHQKGVKFYSDGSIYVGDWLNGQCHTNAIGSLTRLDGLSYEGQWVLGQKHGRGVQKYPDGSCYTGEFAKGCEHGKGKIEYPDKSVFEGRFRFGKKDGPGTLTTRKGEVEKMNYKAKEAHFFDKGIPPVWEQVENPDVDDPSLYIEPESLVSLCIKAVAKTMSLKRQCAPAAKIQNKIPDYLKPHISKLFLNIRYPRGTDKFIEDSSVFAFMPFETMKISNTKLFIADVEALLYFQLANTNLKYLQFTSTRLEVASIGIICKQIGTMCWPNLKNIDLSYNKLESATVKLLLDGIIPMKGLETLSINCCGINSSGAYVISQFLKIDKQLKTLNLAFNKILAQGAEVIAEALSVNQSLTCLNLRSNDIGTVGGYAIVNAIKCKLYNDLNIRSICLSDNNVGSDVIALLGGRLRGSLEEVMDAVRVKELVCPWQYAENRFRQRRNPNKSPGKRPSEKQVEDAAALEWSGDEDVDEDREEQEEEEDKSRGSIGDQDWN